MTCTRRQSSAVSNKLCLHLLLLLEWRLHVQMLRYIRLCPFIPVHTYTVVVRHRDGRGGGRSAAGQLHVCCAHVARQADVQGLGDGGGGSVFIHASSSSSFNVVMDCWCRHVHLCTDCKVLPICVLEMVVRRGQAGGRVRMVVCTAVDAPHHHVTRERRRKGGCRHMAVPADCHCALTPHATPHPTPAAPMACILPLPSRHTALPPHHMTGKAVVGVWGNAGS